MRELRPYQSEAITAVAQKVAEGKRRVVFQLATGGGKTVTFAGLANRYLARNNKKVLIAVHREELLEQARRTLFDWYSIIAYPVVAGQKRIPNVPVYAGMVETVCNRLKKSAEYFGEVGLVIIDECHIGNFKKLHDYFPQAIIIGFSATPVSASKKDPLKNYFEDIVCGVDIPDLIRSGSLVMNRTYHIRNIDRKSLKIRNGEFDDKEMGRQFSNAKQVQNAVEGYRQHAAGTKAIVFNCSIEHSSIVNEAFLSAGIPSRHLDSTMGDDYRKDCLRWFKETPGAVLNNVGILTTGFDEPSVQTVIVNKSTMSLPLWLQMTGRGGRPFAGKDYFTILDMGGNAYFHGDWRASRDWEFIFNNPDEPGKGGGVAPVKECPECEAIIHASATSCPFCGADTKKAMNIDYELREFELLTEERPLRITVDDMIHEATIRDANPYYALHKIKQSIVYAAKRDWKVADMTEPLADKLNDMFQEKVQEWCKAQGKRYNQWHKDTSKEWLDKEIEKVFKWQRPYVPAVAI